jgi:hypothetical protein
MSRKAIARPDAGGYMPTEAKAVDAAEKKEKAKRTVSVLYNGVEKEFRYKPGTKVGELLAEAIAAFGIAANQHLLSLFDAAGRELNEAETLKAAGVEADDELLLRPSEVKGG